MDQNEYFFRAQEYAPRLYRVAYLYLGGEAAAVDAVDEAIYRGYLKRWQLRQPEYLETWLTRILIRECCKTLKRQKRMTPLEDLGEQAAPELDHLPLKEAIAKLPEPLRQIVALRYFAGYTLAETADLLHIPQGTAATRQRRALALLKLELTEEEPI